METKLSEQVYSICPPYWRTYPWGARVRSCDIEGVPNSYANPERFGSSDTEPVAAPVDASIAPLIVSLWRAGLPTAFCCSGLLEDHDDSGDKDPHQITKPSRRAYISFDVPVSVVLGGVLPEPLYFDGDSIIRCRNAAETELRAAWEILTKRVSQLTLSK